MKRCKSSSGLGRYLSQCFNSTISAVSTRPPLLSSPPTAPAPPPLQPTQRTPNISTQTGRIKTQTSSQRRCFVSRPLFVGLHSFYCVFQGGSGRRDGMRSRRCGGLKGKAGGEEEPHPSPTSISLQRRLIAVDCGANSESKAAGALPRLEDVLWPGLMAVEWVRGLEVGWKIQNFGVSTFRKQRPEPLRLSRNESRFSSVYHVTRHQPALRLKGPKSHRHFFKAKDDSVRVQRDAAFRERLQREGIKNESNSSAAAAESWRERERKKRSSQSWPTAPCKFNFPTCLLLDP